MGQKRKEKEKKEEKKKKKGEKKEKENPDFNNTPDESITQAARAR